MASSQKVKAPRTSVVFPDAKGNTHICIAHRATGQDLNRCPCSLGVDSTCKFDNQFTREAWDRIVTEGVPKEDRYVPWSEILCGSAKNRSKMTISTITNRLNTIEVELTTEVADLRRRMDLKRQRDEQAETPDSTNRRQKEAATLRSENDRVRKERDEAREALYTEQLQGSILPSANLPPWAYENRQKGLDDWASTVFFIFDTGCFLHHLDVIQWLVQRAVLLHFILVYPLAVHEELQNHKRKNTPGALAAIKFLNEVTASDPYKLLKQLHVECRLFSVEHPAPQWEDFETSKAYYDTLNVYNDQAIGWLWHKMVRDRDGVAKAQKDDTCVLLLTCDADLPAVPRRLTVGFRTEKSRFYSDCVSRWRRFSSDGTTIGSTYPRRILYIIKLYDSPRRSVLLHKFVYFFPASVCT